MPIRVLIVDDSAVARRLLAEALAADPELAVAGIANSGSVALDRIAELKPDLVTLDIEMPGMDGIATLVEIRKRIPMLPVIMFSSLTGPGASVTVEALSRGASDYVAKPSQKANVDAALAAVRLELIPKIKALCAARKMPATQLAAPSSRPVVTPAPCTPTRVDVVAIGSSTGGPNALAALIPQFPANFPVPIVITQHMPVMFTHLLAKHLDGLTALEVREGKDGPKLAGGDVWIAPGDYHMTVVRKGGDCMLALDQSPPENSCRPAVDVLFRSVAESFGANALAVVLTGMGSDGTRGAAAIRRAGGAILAQDEATSVVWGMPGSVVAAGLADRVCPLSEIAAEITRRARIGRSSVAAGG
jgi:two-component system, chemotaxis family, protein-glutamate methylesterase/glutaminase